MRTAGRPENIEPFYVMAGVGYPLADLERMRDTLAAHIAARQHHLRIDEEQGLIRRRAQRLQTDIQNSQKKLADMLGERDAPLSKRSRGRLFSCLSPDGLGSA